jgi:hypothetical protein
MATHIKNLLPSFLKVSAEQSWKLYLYQHWNTIIGDLQTHVRLEKILDDNSLILGVTNTSWLQELYMLSPVLLKKINESLDKPYVKQVRFKYSPAHKKNAAQEPLKKRTIKKNITISRTEELALERIEDKELKNALKGFLVRCHKER